MAPEKIIQKGMSDGRASQHIEQNTNILKPVDFLLIFFIFFAILLHKFACFLNSSQTRLYTKLSFTDLQFIIATSRIVDDFHMVCLFISEMILFH